MEIIVYHHEDSMHSMFTLTEFIKWFNTTNDTCSIISTKGNEDKNEILLRDYFAGKALQGLLSKGVVSSNAPEVAFKIADLMIQERNDKNE
jgi:hypothetical protein